MIRITKLVVAYTLYDTAGIPVIHMFAAPAARFADNLFPAMRANLLHTLFHIRQLYFLPHAEQTPGTSLPPFCVVVKKYAGA